MNRSQYEKFVERVGASPSPCKNGHPGCSDRDGGKCVDEEWRPEFEERFDPRAGEAWWDAQDVKAEMKFGDDVDDDPPDYEGARL